MTTNEIFDKLNLFMYYRMVTSVSSAALHPTSSFSVGATECVLTTSCVVAASAVAASAVAAADRVVTEDLLHKIRQHL